MVIWHSKKMWFNQQMVIWPANGDLTSKLWFEQQMVIWPAKKNDLIDQQKMVIWPAKNCDLTRKKCDLTSEQWFDQQKIVIWAANGDLTSKKNVLYSPSAIGRSQTGLVFWHLRAPTLTHTLYEYICTIYTYIEDGQCPIWSHVQTFLLYLCVSNSQSMMVSIYPLHGHRG